ncbi:MAG: sulfite exporter TauE/SafE family protein [Chloroflexi bacterium]|nr:MAG: sulfite exporter TauE/SafE family protein [Chloroflexota bacterium]
MPDEVITAIAGLVASFLSGLLGIGGGLVLTPLLLYLPPVVGGAAIPVKIVTGLTIVQAISGSVLGALRHRAYGNVSPRLVWLMGPPSAVASLVGAFISRDVADNVILLVFAILAFTGGIMLLLPVTPRDEGAEDIRADPRVAIPIALVLGFLGGIVGIGGIAFIIAALVYVLRVPARIAIGTSLGIGLFAALAALIGKAATAQIDPPLAAVVFVSALVASPIGAAVSVRTQPRALLAILSVVVMLAAIRVAFTAVTGS